MNYKNLKFEYLFKLINLINQSKTKDISFIYNMYKRSSENFDGSMKILIKLQFIKVIKDQILENPFRAVDEKIIQSRQKFSHLIIQRLLMHDSIKDEIQQYFSRYSKHSSYAMACKVDKENSLNNINLRNFLMTLDLIRTDKIEEVFFVNLNLLPKIKSLLSPKKFSLEQLDNKILSNQKIGDLAEDIVVKYEIKRLNKDTSFSERLVKKISVDQVNAGYDIESHLIRNNNFIPIKIEVKAVSKKDYRFYWSKNEMNTAKKYLDRYYLYLVPCTGNNQLDIDNIKIIKNPHTNIIKNKSWYCEIESASFCWTNK